MKKRKICILILIILFALTGCTKTTPQSIYEDAVKNTKKDDALQMELHMQTKINDAGSEMESVISGNVKITGIYSEEGELAMDGNIATNRGSVEPMSIPMAYYYTGGSLYTNMMNSQYQMETSWEDAKSQIGVDIFVLAESRTEDFKSLELEESETGGYVLTYVIAGEDASKVTSAQMIIQQYEGTQAEIKFQDIEGTITIGKDKRFCSQTMLLKASVTSEAQTITIESSLMVDIHDSGKDVTIDFPDLSSYQVLHP